MSVLDPSPDASLYVGQVMHRRTKPRRHRFTYRLFAIALDLDCIDAVDRRLKLFSVGRFNLLSFRARDFGDGSDLPLKDQLVARCATDRIYGIERVVLVTMPRLLGFAFNPLSLFFCFDHQGRNRAIVHEVHNTFGERHFYVQPVDYRGTARHEAPKAFHVSPFLPMGLGYRFRVRPLGERYDVAITVSDSEGPVLVAIQKMAREELTDWTIIRAALAFPVMTVKVVAGILWEAARLWLKGIRVYPHPSKVKFGGGELPTTPPPHPPRGSKKATARGPRKAA